MSVHSLTVPFVRLLRKTCEANGYSIRKHHGLLGIYTSTGTPSDLWSHMIEASVPDVFRTHEEIDVMRHQLQELSSLMRCTSETHMGGTNVFFNPHVVWSEEYEEGFDPEEDCTDVNP